MHRTSFALGLFALVGTLALPARAADTLVQFSGAIGVDPVAGLAAGVPVVNTVLGVPPGGRPWILRKLRATVYDDGTVSIRGRGLLLSATDAIGTRGGVTQVFATLFCGGIAHNTSFVPLDLAGDFRINGALSAAPPNPCTAPALLIRSAAGAQSWFAAGIPGSGDDD